MSWNPTTGLQDPSPDQMDLVETQIVPRARDLGGFEVRRALPAPERQMVGPFIFFDAVGPAEFLTNQGIDVRPHPHIGLATVTYLFEGEIRHRDSLGVDQLIRPGEVNWMVAGKGVTHSERTSAQTREHPHALYGIQTWVALPDDHEETDPQFEHQAEEALPFIEAEGKTIRLILGNAYGARAPVQTFSEMFYADAVLEPGALLPLPDDHEDRGIYVLEGSVEIAGERFEAHRMMVFRPGDAISVRAGEQGARLVVLGGETLGGPRYIWWNFVASSEEKIEAAKEAWQSQAWRTEDDPRFTLPAGDDAEFIPLP